MLRMLSRVVAGTALAAVLAVPAMAEPVAVQGGSPTALPLSGLSITLPVGSYKVSGQWTLTDNGTNFAGSDTIDQLGATGQAASSTRISIGYFDGGDPAASVQETLDNFWDDNVMLWGQQWTAHGGDANGAHIVNIAMKKNDMAPVFKIRVAFTGAEGPVSQQQVVEALPNLAAAQAAFTAYQNGTTAPTQPAKAPEVTQPMGVTAARSAHLPIANRDIMLPDDGQVWVVEANPAKETGSDIFYRMAPSQPTATLVLFSSPAKSAEDLFKRYPAGATRQDAAPANIPAGWENGATILGGPQEEYTIVKVINGKALVLGFLSDKVPTDLTPFAGIAASVAAGVQ